MDGVAKTKVTRKLRPTNQTMKREIKKTNDPILRKPTEKVEDFDLELQSIIDDMIETMRSESGVGLAAPQIGISKKILVCEYPTNEESKIKGFPLTVICNPEITYSSKDQCRMVEGCLSFPGLDVLVKRPKKIKITGHDRYGKKLELEADELFARVLQHENDHLNSTLLIDHIKEVDTVFIGTGSLGADTLEAIAVDAQYRIKLVITSDFEAVSRTTKENQIAKIAKKYKLPLIKTRNINTPEVVEKIKSLKPEIGIMADFGQIIKPEILKIPKYGIVNNHPSLLPKHRGPSPIQQTILDGDKKAGVTLILTGAKMDAGDIISQAIVKLSGSETSTILKDYLAGMAASLILNSIPYYLAGDLKPEPQRESQATYSRLFKKEDGLVTTETSAVEVERKIRAFDSWPKVFVVAKDKRIQICAVHFDQDKKLVIDRVKPESKQEMSYEDFVRGYHTELTFMP